MDNGMISPTALLTALALAEQHGSPVAAVRACGLQQGDAEPADWLHHPLASLSAAGTGREGLGKALALGFLAGRLTHDRSSFLMDRELLVRGAEGDAILRLPWFAEDLFVGRPLPDIREMPADVRNACIANYRAALAGERRRFDFASCGLAYRVDAIPVQGEDDRVTAVLAIARRVPGADRQAAARLTAREVELLQLAANGMSGPAIAEHLVISPGTVKTHFQHIYAKLGVGDRAGAVAIGLRSGIIR